MNQSNKSDIFRLESGCFRKESCKVKKMHKASLGDISYCPPEILEVFVP